MLIAYIYSEKTKKLKFRDLHEDDRSYQSECHNGLHEFAPGSHECACGKYKDINLLGKKK